MKIKKTFKTILFVCGGIFLTGILIAAIADGIQSIDSNPGTGPAAELVGTKWYSRRLTYDPEMGRHNNVILTFFKDSVYFDLPNGSSFDISQLLGKTGPGQHPTHYNWGYDAEEKIITLDPSVFGNSVQLEKSGDSLVWKGALPPGRSYLSFKQVADTIFPY